PLVSQVVSQSGIITGYRSGVPDVGTAVQVADLVPLYLRRLMPRVTLTFTAVSLLALSGCAGKTDPAGKSDSAAYQELVRLPTGAQLDPAGRSVEIGDFPITEILSPDRGRLILLLGAYRQQGVQVVDRRSG